MEFDFCLVASWSEQSQRQVITWGTELESRGYTVAIVSPSPSQQLSRTDIQTFVLAEFEDPTDIESVDAIESRYGIPSLDHLAFTERLYFGLSRAEAVARAARLATLIGRLFSDHSFEYTYQIRGPEIHRLLAHYITEHEGGTSIWGEFSPFDNTFALTTLLDGSWEAYQTVPYEEIPSDDKQSIKKHIEQFREERRFYAHDDDDESDDETESQQSLFTQVTDIVRNAIRRTRPGRFRDQITPTLRLKANQRLNDYLLPTVEQSRQLCHDTDYVFFPLQYQIESRLTVFAPQFYDQSYLIEYLGRVLPSSTQLFVKGHPNHPGRPAPETIHKLQEENRVRFLDHELNAHEVIEHSEGVVVVNNTVGFETIYHQKPLFALGDSPYAETPAVTNVESLDTLPKVLGQQISTAVPEETAIESIYSLKEATAAGDRTSHEADNVRTYIDSMLSFVTK